MRLVLETVISVILYMVYHTLWLRIASHLLHWHMEYVTASSSDHTGIASFIDAASYLVGYEGRRHDICTILLFSWHLHCIGIWSYVAASSRDRTSTTSFIGHNDAASYLWGMKARDMTFALHMHYDFGLWYICFGFRILERY